jgi:carbon starvation protein
MLTREKDIRVIGYGAMVTEMLVGVLALIAACSMEPGEYFAINMSGDASKVTAQVTALGFPVTETQMASLAADVGEKTLVGRTGGAPTFAVGMARMFAGVLGSREAMALWYHFAIMFEALFILTTIDAGTRVGRFLMQDLLGLFSRRLADTANPLSSVLATLTFVGAWGWFLYQGVLDPLGGINSLWPIFGVANQLLAVIALALGTTVLLKMGKARYAWVTLLPLGWLLAVTMSAGLLKVFSADPRLGFLRAASDLSARIQAGGTETQLAQWNHLLINNYVNAGVTMLFLVLVVLVLASNVRLWVALAQRRPVLPLAEEPRVGMEDALTNRG